LFTHKQGIQDNEFYKGNIKLNTGEIVVGGINGFNIFHPDSIVYNQYLPKTWLSSIVLNDSILNCFQFEVLAKKLKHNQNNLSFQFTAFDFNFPEENKFAYFLEGYDKDWNYVDANQRFAKYTNLPSKEFTLKIKAANNDGVWSDEVFQISFKISPPWWKTWWFYFISIITVFGCFMLFYKWRTASLKARQKMLEQKVKERTRELKVKNDELVIEKREVENQKHLVEEQNKEILDSINYAKRIQTAILPPPRVVKSFLDDSFILYIPKDIVAGDFYWMESVEKENTIRRILFAAADCTGHGVPGAMVSVICNNGLNRSVREYGITEPGKILDKTREIVIEEFQKSEEEVKDGMDIALCCLEITPKGFQLKYAGANNPLWIIRKGSQEIEEIKANKQPIGKYADHSPFTTHTLQLEKGDSIYIFTDGFQDQFGGEKGKKFKPANLKNLILSSQHLPMQEQRDLLLKAFDAWKGELEQVDDVCVIGVRV
jgi:serine phosphatase RsbU (regulator of sigma subunit)